MTWFKEKNIFVTTSVQKEYDIPDEDGKFYRIITWVDSSHSYRTVSLHFMEFILVKKTPKGFWIREKWDHDAEYQKWVSSTSRKRFAYPTKREALIGYIKRTNRYISILTSKTKDAEIGVKIGNKLMEVISG